MKLGWSTICPNNFCRKSFCSFCNFITRNHVITNVILPSYLPFSHLHIAGFYTRDALSDFYTDTDIYCYSTYDVSCIFCYQTSMYVFDTFISAIILETCIFKYFVLFGKHTLLDRSLKPLLPTHLFKLA